MLKKNEKKIGGRIITKWKTQVKPNDKTIARKLLKIHIADLPICIFVYYTSSTHNSYSFVSLAYKTAGRMKLF